MNLMSRRRFLSASALGTAAWASRGPLSAYGAPVMDAIPTASNLFNADFFQHVSATPGNAFFSALSIETAFAMLAAGAKGDTAQQMANVLHFPADMATVHTGFKSLLGKLNNDKVPVDKRGFELRIANALWGTHTYPWRKEYLTLTNEHYGAGLMETNFSESEAARQKINTWVEQQTREKIKDLLPKGSITGLTRLVLTNAIYFKGKWEAAFDKKRTQDGAFAHANGKTHQVPLMNKQAEFAYTENNTWQAVELPYIGEETSMVILLPKKRGGLAEVQKNVSAKMIDELTSKMKYRMPVNVTLPRFKVETEYDLIAPLKKLGMVNVFGEKADLTGLHTSSEHLYVSAAIHKAFCEVNEEGTEAAAATGVVVATRSAPPPPKEFKADHPFVFAIRHRPTNTLLFFGKVENL